MAREYGEWVARLGNAVKSDRRAFGSVLGSEGGLAYCLRTQPGPVTGASTPPGRDQWRKYSFAIAERLVIDRGMTWGERLGLLLTEYPLVALGEYEWVVEFARRFCENGQTLCKFIIDAHRHRSEDSSYPEGYYSDLEQRAKFRLGLRPEVSKGPLSRVDQYYTLELVVVAASRFDAQFPPRGRTSKSDGHVLATGWGTKGLR